jgi:bacterioferritin
LRSGVVSRGPQTKKPTSKKADEKITRERLAELLNEDLSREYQAIIAYVAYSQVLKGAEYMNIADGTQVTGLGFA